MGTIGVLVTGVFATGDVVTGESELAVFDAGLVVPKTGDNGVG